MERERPRPPRHEEPEPSERVSPPQSEPRCPYCHADLAEGELASECSKCQTLQHVACFGENRGCSTLGCGSHRARSVQVGATEEQPKIAELRCAHCKQAIATNELVARCDCGVVLDVGCLDQVKACTVCSQRPELMTHGEAIAAKKRKMARAHTVFSGILAALSALFVLMYDVGAGGLKNPNELLVLFSVFAVVAMALFAFAQRERHLAGKLEQLPPPRLGGAPAPAVSEDPKQKDPKQKEK